MITNEEYTQQVPEELREETSSEFLFVCSNPKKLPVPLNVSGQHKICKKFPKKFSFYW